MKKVVLLSAIALLLLPVFAHAVIDLNLEYPSFGGFDLNQDQQLNDIVAWFYYFIVGISGFAAFTMLIWGGITWLSSAGSPAGIADAKDRIQKALLGLLLVLGSFIILQVLNPDLTILKNPDLTRANIPDLVLGGGYLPGPDPSGVQGDPTACIRKESPSSGNSSSPLFAPVDGKVSSPFGIRTDPTTGLATECHSGVDIGDSAGETILATQDGTVTFAGGNPCCSYGLNVIVNHGTYSTRYGHMERILTSQGAQIKRGDSIGIVGSTGRSTGPHVHYEVLKTATSERQNANAAVWGVCGMLNCKQDSKTFITPR